MTNLDLRSLMQPLPRRAVLRQDDYLTWCGTMTRTDDGVCHLYFSRWPRELGHAAWVTHSEIAYATAPDPLGPYEFQSVVLGRRDCDCWDRDVAHNPTVLQRNGWFYLYYTGNYGNGEFWDHRSRQRVGVAVAEHPAGPWRRFNAPLLDVTRGAWDCLLTTNPSCTPTPDGRFLLMYKAVGQSAPPPMCGPVLHGVAFGPTPTGPYVKHPAPIFQSGEANFPAEDPFVWQQDGRLYAMVKDQGRFYSDAERALVLFESDNGTDWTLAAQPIVTTRKVVWEDGEEQEFYRLERPQLYLENGAPRVLFCAVKPHEKEHDSYNIHIPLAPR